VRVLVTVDVTGYGRVEEGIQDLPEDLARLLVERGFGHPAEDSAPEDASPGDSGKKKK
jgi:hypothetical protein